MISSLTLQLLRMKVVFLIFVISTFTNGLVIIDESLIEKFLRAGLNHAAIAIRDPPEMPLWKMDPYQVQIPSTKMKDKLGYECFS